MLFRDELRREPSHEAFRFAHAPKQCICKCFKSFSTSTFGVTVT